MKKQIYFSHIPKTAGQTIVNIIEKESKKKKKNISIGEKYFFQVVFKKYKFYYEHYLQDKYLKKMIKFPDPTYKYSKSDNHWNIVFWHLPLSFWKDEILLDLKKKNTIFLTVRNPYDRIVSDFKFWIKFYKAQINGRIKDKYKNLLLEIKDIYENNFELSEENMNYFIQKVLGSTRYKYKLDGHLIPQHKYIYTIINKKLIKIPDFIIRFENLEDNFINFKKKYANFIPNNAIKSTHINPTQNKSLNISKLTKKSKNLIYNYYRLDFKILNYF